MCSIPQYKEFGLKGNDMWLAASADRRVSIWASDWMKDKCELLDWLTFPAPAHPKVKFLTPCAVTLTKDIAYGRMAS